MMIQGWGSLTKCGIDGQVGVAKDRKKGKK